MEPIAIRAEGLGKRYRINGNVGLFQKTLTDRLGRLFRLPAARGREAPASTRSAEGYLWALRGVNLEIHQGEVVGIIGRNGAGKSTLLKLLSRITQPTEGTAELHGRVGSLLEVGTGFHPELTGRENIYLNGAILGMKKTEITAKFDQIVDFAELGRFIDTPVKHYSSGMYVRLAFAVAAHLELETLLVDEVLAVGDLAFQKKCIGKMSEVAHGGRTVLFVSHNMTAVSHLCTKGVLLEKGMIACSGTIETAVESYQRSASESGDEGTEIFRNRTGTGLLRFRNVAVANSQKESTLRTGDEVTIEMQLEGEARTRASNVKIGVGINGAYGERLITLLNTFDPAVASEHLLGEGSVVRCTIPALPLRPGTYYLSFYIDINHEVADATKDALKIQVHEADFFGTGVLPSLSQGPFVVAQHWDYL